MNDNKNPTAAQPLDLDNLEALARAADCSPLASGPWIALASALNPRVILALIAQARASQPEGATGTTGAQQFDQDETHLNKIMRGVITDVGTHKPIDMLADPAAVAPSDAKNATVPDHSEREAANAGDLTLQQLADGIADQGVMSPHEFRAFLNGDGVEMYPHQLLRMVNLFAHKAANAKDAALLKALHAAVSALYFDDSSDFRSALGAVIRHLDRELAGEMLGSTKAAYDKVCAEMAAVGAAGQKGGDK